MWVWLKWGLRLTLIAGVAGFLHYTLPQRDIVRITNTYNRVTTVGENWMFYAAPDAGTADGADTRDIRFIEAAFVDDRVMVYRNEDTGWVWPPYFKYDSSNLQAQATNLQSTKAAPQWVAVTHYGWRLPILSIYPNAVAVRAVAGPDVQLFPWVNIVILTGLAALVLMLWRMWAQFRERMIEPAIDDVNRTLDVLDQRADAARDNARGTLARARRWLGGLFGRR